MSRDHEHIGHSHGLGHTTPDFSNAFLIGISLNAGFIMVETIMGFSAGSLALLSDAGHNLGDVLGLLLAWLATLLAKRPAIGRFTYGFKRTTILSALINAILLLVAVGAIGLEAIHRLRAPAAVHAGVVAWVSGLGIFINGITAMLFMSGRKSDLNVRGAFLHMITDAAVSFGVMFSGILILFTDWVWLDPIVSILILIVILVGTWGLFMESLGLTLDAAPTSIDLTKVRTLMADLPGVVDVHHLHVWALSTTETALTAHVIKSNPMLDDSLLAMIHKKLEEHFSISHVTIQLEQSCMTHQKE